MKKLIAAALLVNLSAAVHAAGMEQLRAAGFAPITMEEIKARPFAGDKKVSIVINNTNTGNGVSSVHTNVNVNGSDVNSPGSGAVNVAVNNNSAHNNVSNVTTHVNAHNSGTNSPGSDNIHVGVNNNSAHNGVSSVDTDVNINNTNDGAYSDDDVSVNIDNNNNGNGAANTNTDVNVNGVNANAAREAVYQSPMTYRFRNQAQQALEKALNNLGGMKNVQVVSKDIIERFGSGFTFEIRFRSAIALRTYVSQKLFAYPAQAENLMFNKVLELRDRKARIVSAEVIDCGNNYAYIIAFFPAK